MGGTDCSWELRCTWYCPMLAFGRFPERQFWARRAGNLACLLPLLEGKESNPVSLTVLSGDPVPISGEFL